MGSKADGGVNIRLTTWKLASPRSKYLISCLMVHLRREMMAFAKEG
jgi:hypothetical protein